MRSTTESSITVKAKAFFFVSMHPCRRAGTGKSCPLALVLTPFYITGFSGLFGIGRACLLCLSPKQVPNFVLSFALVGYSAYGRWSIKLINGYLVAWRSRPLVSFGTSVLWGSVVHTRDSIQMRDTRAPQYFGKERIGPACIQTHPCTINSLHQVISFPDHMPYP